MTWLWLAWALTGFGMEMYALFNSRPNDTLTATIVTHFPVAWILLAAAWVPLHFAAAVKHRGQER